MLHPQAILPKEPRLYKQVTSFTPP